MALVLALASACGGPAETAPSAGDEVTSTGGEAARAVWTGDVSEDAFRQLHELTTEAAPPLRGQTIDLDGSQAYLSLPESEPRAAVLVIHEWWGLNDHIRHWTDRLAADGYAALAVDLYGGRVATTPEEAMERMRGVDEERSLAILRRAAAFLREGPQVSAQRVGVIGWCFGGGWSLESALHVDGFDAVVMYYGRPVTDPARLRELDGPLLGIFANRDTSIPPERVDELDRALSEAGAEHRILRYDADHAFANPSSARYDHEAASAAWEEVRAFLHAALRPSVEPALNAED